MSAVEEYQKVAAIVASKTYWDVSRSEIVEAADAALAAFKEKTYDEVQKLQDRITELERMLRLSIIDTLQAQLDDHGGGGNIPDDDEIDEWLADLKARAGS
jgi:hypothetical protein